MGMVAATIASAAATVVSGVMQKQAADQQASVQRSEADNAQKQYQFNADRARTEANDLAEQERSQEQELRDRARQAQGTQRAQAGASGVDVGSGSPFDVLTGMNYMEDQDAATLRFNAKRSEGARTAEAQNYEWNGREAKNIGYAKAKATENAGSAALWGSLLGAATGVASKWDYLAGGGKAAGSAASTVSDWHDAGNAFGIKNAASAVGKRSYYKGYWGLN